jgi:hypothetical protein
MSLDADTGARTIRVHIRIALQRDAPSGRVLGGFGHSEVPSPGELSITFPVLKDEGRSTVAAMP